MDNEQEIIVKILQQHKDAFDNGKRIKSILADYLPEKKALRHVLCAAYDEGIVFDAMESDDYLKISYKFTKILVEDYAIGREHAEWAVDTWIFAVNPKIKKITTKSENDKLDVQIKTRSKTDKETTAEKKVIRNSTVASYQVPQREAHASYCFDSNLYTGKYIGVTSCGSYRTEKTLECDEKRYTVIPFDKINALRFEVGTKVQFRVVNIGKYKYAYDLVLIHSAFKKEKITINNSGKDVMHRSGIIEKLESDQGIIFENENNQRYSFIVNQRILDNKIKVGDRVAFTLAVSDGKLFATEINAGL